MSKMEIATLKHAYRVEASGAGRNRVKLGLGFAGVAAGLFLAWRLGAFDLLSVANIDRLDAWFAGLGYKAFLYRLEKFGMEEESEDVAESSDMGS